MAKTKSTQKKKRPSPDNIVDLTLEDDDDDDDAYSSDMRRAISASLNSVRKRIRSSTPASLRIKKVKTEGSSTRNAATAFLKDADGEIEVLEGDAVRQHQQQIQLSSPAAAAAASTQNNDDTVAVVGTRNHVRLPHARMHCTEKTFNNDLGYSLAARRAVNCVACEDCYCYVCDVPHQQCQGNWAEDHCLATDQGPRKEYWAQQRRARAQLKQQQGGGGAMTVSTTATARRRRREEPRPGSVICVTSALALRRSSRNGVGTTKTKTTVTIRTIHTTTSLVEAEDVETTLKWPIKSTSFTVPIVTATSVTHPPASVLRGTPTIPTTKINTATPSRGQNGIVRVDAS